MVRRRRCFVAAISTEVFPVSCEAIKGVTIKYRALGELTAVSVASAIYTKVATVCFGINTAISRKLDPAKQAAFIRSYEAQLNQLPGDEAVMFAEAVHPTHAVRAVGCWAPKDIPVAITQSSGRERLNIHGAIDLETGNTRMLDVLVVNAASTIMLLMAIEAMYPGKRLIHVFLDNARYHHAKLVQQWLARSGCRVRLHFIPSYCPHLDPIERLWGLMHRHCTHNKCYAGFKDFTRVVLTFLREKVPRNWHVYCDQVTDNFRVIDPADFRVLV